MATSSKRPKFMHKIVDDLTEGKTFDHLPDEVQLKIVKFLEIKDIIRCTQVSKRTRRICRDGSIWKKVNLFRKVVPSEFIVMILENGCKYINLQSAKIVGSLTLSRNDYNVKYLNLSYCNADKGVLEKLISSCQGLQKLSLAGLSLRSDAMTSRKHQHLKILHLWDFQGMDLKLISNILSSKTLTEISYRNHEIPYNSDSDIVVQYLVENLSSDVEKVSLGGLTCLTDKQLKTLVKRCKKIKELELWGCRLITDDSLNSIVEHSEIVKLDISKTKIVLIWNDQLGRFIKPPLQETNPLLKIQSMPKLKHLNCRVDTRGYPSSYEEIENLRKLMPQIIINEGAYGGDLDMADQNEFIKPEDGLWDIFVKRIELFPMAYYLVDYIHRDLSGSTHFPIGF